MAQPMHATCKSALKAAGCSDADCQQLEAAIQAGTIDWSKLATLIQMLPQFLPILLALFGTTPTSVRSGEPWTYS